MTTPAEVKQQVRQFYDQVGWQEVSEGTYQNAHYEDLRPVSARVHPPLPPARDAAYQSRRALLAGRRLRADPVPRVPGVFPGIPSPGMRRHLHPGLAGGSQAHRGSWTVRCGRYCQPAFRWRCVRRRGLAAHHPPPAGGRAPACLPGAAACPFSGRARRGGERLA